MTSPLRLVLADDHHLVRAGLRALAERLPGVDVVGEAADGRELVELCRRLQPDVAVTDIQMPELGGLEAIVHIRMASPSTRVLVLSMFAGEDFVLRAMRSGAAGYLLKDAAAAELGLALDAVRRGQPYLSPQASAHLVHAVHERPADTGPALTPRQTEILTLVAKGLGTREIADALGLSHKTVESHRAQIMQRLDVHDLPSLVLHAVRLGLVRVDQPS